MTKHSKNNTASSIFSYAEHKKLDYGTKRRAREPVSCQKGHLFCKECVYTDLVTQLADIKKQKARLETLKREAEEEKEKAREAARERVLVEFERGQLGLAAPTSAVTTSGAESKDSRGTKRKFAFDSTTAETLAREAEEAALREIEREQAEALKHKLPDFWLPSLTPTYTTSGPPTSLSDVKLQTSCRAAKPSHALLRKNLIQVKFTLDNSTPGSAESTPTSSGQKAKNEDAEPICPSCKKGFSNNTLMFYVAVGEKPVLQMLDSAACASGTSKAPDLTSPSEVLLITVRKNVAPYMHIRYNDLQKILKFCIAILVMDSKREIALQAEPERNQTLAADLAGVMWASRDILSAQLSVRIFLGS
ncbi:hypothetical protein EIP91_000410 [Steccherinum ochraceum]|uniref:Nitric oxide synthase-interacting protein zinc-finger domain-containing protein n=1 Tax=Steccherinum ochraceum TaxID=92696 RepID=A0A4R0RWE1_9APHY|nr:hypothetical protein EIP91_000410 [Steccherinum ochraceum]